MNSVSNESESREAKWARKHLDLPNDFTPDDLRRQFLRRVALFHLVPSEDCCDAFAILASKDLSTPRAAGTERVRFQRLQQEVETFAQQFFSYPPRERTEVWQSLLSQTSDAPIAQARLRGLQRALNIEFDPDLARLLAVGRLALQFADIVVARPVEAVAIRQALLAQHRRSQREANTSVRQFSISYPDLANLEAPLVVRLSSTRPPRAPPQQLASAKSANEKNTSYAWIIVFVAVGSLVGRFFSSVQSPQGPSYTPPPLNGFDPAERRRMLEPHRDTDGDIVVFADDKLTIAFRGTVRLAKRKPHKPNISNRQFDGRSNDTSSSQSANFGDTAGDQPLPAVPDAIANQATSPNEIVLFRESHEISDPFEVTLQNSDWGRIKKAQPELWGKLLAWSRYEVELTEDDVAQLRAPANRSSWAGSAKR